MICLLCETFFGKTTRVYLMDFLGAIMGWGQVQNNMVCLGKVPMPLPLCLLPKNIHTYNQQCVAVGTIHVHLFNRLRFFWKGEQEKKTKSGRFFFQSKWRVMYTSADFVLKDVIYDYKVHLCRPKNKGSLVPRQGQKGEIKTFCKKIAKLYTY